MEQNPYRGSNFDDFLAEEGILEEVTLRAQKRLLVWQEEIELFVVDGISYHKIEIQE